MTSPGPSPAASLPENMRRNFKCGIPISSSCEVMGDNGPIQNLFAAGDNSSGNIVKLSQTEKMWITNESSWALSSGMIAADGMLEALS